MPEISEEGQEKLLSSRVAIIGAGGLGCPVGLYLAGAGIGSITIIDNDHIEISNLNRQIAFSTHDIGLSKSKCLEKVIKKNNPDLGLICPSYPEGIAKLMPVGIAWLSKVDKIIFIAEKYIEKLPQLYKS